METLITCDHMDLGYENQDAVLDVTNQVNAGDYLCIVGENGSGKSTLIKGILGLLKPTGGTLTVAEELKKSGIGYLPQQMKVADTTTLAEETAKAFDEVLRLEAEIGRITHEIAERTDYESAAYGQLLHRLTEAQDRYHILGGETRDADIEKTLLGLGFRREDFGRATSEFSGGWRMRIELAKLLLRVPNLLAKPET